jgi:hypothetical protein
MSIAKFNCNFNKKAVSNNVFETAFFINWWLNTETCLLYFSPSIATFMFPFTFIKAIIA